MSLPPVDTGATPLLAQAEALLITAGSGMSAESVPPGVRGKRLVVVEVGAGEGAASVRRPEDAASMWRRTSPNSRVCWRGRT